MRRVLAYGVMGLAGAIGCSKGSLEGNDDGGPGPGDAPVVVDTGPRDVPPLFDSPIVDAPIVTDAPPHTDAPILTDVAFETGVERPRVGRRSFYVTSTFTQVTDGGFGTVPLGTGHRFTMVIDWDQNIAIVGSGAGGGVARLQATPTGGRTIDQITFNFGGGLSVTYASIDFAVDSAGVLTGSGGGTGNYNPPTSDVGNFNQVTMSLTGLPDTEPPAFTSSLNTTLVDPFAALTVTPTEPLPIGTAVRLVDQAGGGLDLIANGIDISGSGTPAAVFSFVPPLFRMWRYSDRYTLVTTGVLDFAGNAPASGDTVTFTTVPPPPLAAEDGFESVTGPTLNGAQVLTGAGGPALAGAQSLYIPPVASMSPVAGGTVQLALRLALAPGDTMVRFSYRTVKPNGYGSATSVPARWLMASEGGAVVALTPAFTETPATTQTIAPFGDLLLGPTTTATLALPADAADEITLERVVPQAGSLPPHPVVVVGLIIDDLRAE